FNEIITDIRERGNRMGWSLHTIPIQTAVDQGLVERIKASNAKRPVAFSTNSLSSPGGEGRGEEANFEKEEAPIRKEEASRQQWLLQQRAECIDEEQWLQEYCCIPANEATAFIPYELTNGCTEPDCLKDFDYLAACPNPLFLGLDVARKK